MNLVLAFFLAVLFCAPAACAEDVHSEELRAGAGTPIDNWVDLRAAFVRCWTVPKGTEGSLVAFRFLFAPHGGLRGPPKVLAKILKGDDDAKKRYETAAYATLDRCLPIIVTPGFKQIMGESLIQLRLVNTKREPAPNLGPAMTIFAEEAGREAE